MSFDMEATLCIYDALQEEANIGARMILGIMSAGGRRPGQAVDQLPEILVPCPTNEEMGRICYLQEDRNVGRQFQRLFKLVGNNLRRCFGVEYARNEVIERQIGDLENLNILDPDYVEGHIFDDNCYLHSLIKIVPVSRDDTGDFDSFRRYQVDYWSSEISKRVSDKLLQVAQNNNLLLPWVGYENRLVTGILLEVLVHQISRKYSIRGVKGTVIVTVNDNNEIKAERSSDPWSVPEELIKLMPNFVEGKLESVARMLDCYFKPGSLRQPLYDSIVIHSDGINIDLLQITVAKEHDFHIGEFKKLLEVWPNGKRFRFFTIRLALNENEVKEMMSGEKKFTWRMKDSPEGLEHLLTHEVSWYECVVDCEKLMIEYKKHSSKRS
jgi:hypothetical protein